MPSSPSEASDPGLLEGSRFGFPRRRGAKLARRTKTSTIENSWAAGRATQLVLTRLGARSRPWCNRPRIVTDLARILERATSLSGVDPSVVERFARSATQRTYPHGEYLWHAGERPGAYSVIRAGLVKVVSESVPGRTSLLGLFGPPDSVGEIAVLKGIPYPADAVVVSDHATIIEIPRDTFLEELNRVPQLSISVAQGMHTKLSTLRNKVDVLSAGSVDARLATLIVKLYQQFGDDFEDGTSKIPVVLARKELAQLVSTTLETAIRTMTKWERDGVLETAADGFVLRDVSALCLAAGMKPERE